MQGQQDGHAGMTQPVIVTVKTIIDRWPIDLRPGNHGTLCEVDTTPNGWLTSPAITKCPTTEPLNPALDLTVIPKTHADL